MQEGFTAFSAGPVVFTFDPYVLDKFRRRGIEVRFTRDRHLRCAKTTLALLF